MPRPIVATIHLAAMQHNLSVARRLAGSSKIWAIVKANGYGHSLERSMRGFADADGLALIEIGAAVHLRKLGWTKPILLLQGFFEPVDLDIVYRHQLHVVVHSEEQIAMLGESSTPSPVDVYLKINSGMNRLGFPPEKAAPAYARLRSIAHVRSITLMTHFANSYAAETPINGIAVSEQTFRFNAVATALGCARSFADSATVITKPGHTADWVRPGVMLYGATVFVGQSAEEFDLIPAMTLASEIIGIQDIGVGDSVGYGSRFIANKPMRIGVVACGYTDGYPRSAQDGTPVLVDGVKTSVVGRVSMDSITVDLTPIPTARVGSKVVLWGQGLAVEEVAAAAGTIACELMCGLTRRVHVVDG